MKTRVLVSKINQDEGKMIVFTEDRKFLKLVIPDELSPSPGEMVEIDLPEETENKSTHNRKWFFQVYHSNKKRITAAAMIMLLVIGMFYGGNNEISAAAYVNLDMNSSIQMEVDENGVVQKIEGLDSEGEDIVNLIKLDDRDLYSIIQELVKREYISEGTFKQNEAIVMVSFVQLSETQTPSINEEKLRVLINRELELKKISGYIVINPTTKDQWEETKESGYTMNEYMLMNHAKEHGVEIRESQFHREHGAAEYMVKNKIPTKQIFPNTSYEVSREKTDFEHINRTDIEHEERNSDHKNRDVQQKEHSTSTDKESRQNSNMDHNDSGWNTHDNTREEKIDNHNIESNLPKQGQTNQNQYQFTPPTQDEMEMNGEPSRTEERHTMDSRDGNRKEHGR